jgi:2-methylcitrate dehydratase PrpD
MNKNLTTVLAEFCSNLRYEDIPKETVGAAKRFVLDYLASVLAGYKVNRGFNDMLYAMVSEAGGKEESTVLLYGGKLPIQKAALINSAIGHGADIDDGHRTANGHPGVVTVPVALALAEAYGLSGKEVLTGVVAGYEVFIRIGTAVNPWHVSHGFHSTGTIGALAATATAVNMLRLNPSQAENALGFGCLQAAGLLEIVESGQMSKGLNCAKSCDSGIFAALLAKKGAQSPLNVLQGKKGFFNAFAGGQPDTAPVEDDLCKVFLIDTAYIKYYPSCRHTHGAIDAGIRFFKDPSLKLENVKSITVSIYQNALSITGNIRVPDTIEGAKFSLTYCLAVAMNTGSYTLTNLDTKATLNKSILETIDKISLELDSSLEDRAKGWRGTRITWYMTDGPAITETIPVPKGDPGTPQTPDDMRAKVAFCSEGILDNSAQAKMTDIVSNLENAKDVSALIRCFIK